MNQLAGQTPQLIVAWASGYNTVAPNMAQQLSIPVDELRPRHRAANVPGLVNAIEEKPRTALPRRCPRREA